MTSSPPALAAACRRPASTNRLRREPGSKLVVRAEQATHPDHGSLDIEQLPGVDLRRRVRRLALSALISPSHARPAEHAPPAVSQSTPKHAGWLRWSGCLPSAHALLGPRDGVVLVRGHLRRSQRRVEVCLLGHLTEHARCELRPEAGHGGGKPSHLVFQVFVRHPHDLRVQIDLPSSRLKCAKCEKQFRLASNH